MKLCIAALLLFSSGALAAGQEYSVTVTAGAFDRDGTIVSFRFPDRVDDGIYAMESGSGDPVYLQVDDNEGWFILDQLKAGASRTFTVSPGPLPAREAFLEVTRQDGDPEVSFRSGTKEVLSYYHSESKLPDGVSDRYRRAGYIHPVYTPGGTVVTNHMSEGREHHYGIWSAWTNTQFQGRTPDFWNAHDGSGRVDGDSLEAAWDGPVHGGFRSNHRFTDLSGPEPVIALNEHWEVRVYRSPQNGAYHIFDLTMTHTANTGSPLALPEYRYGGLGVRGHGDWNEEGNLFFLTSEGYDYSNGNGTRARWSHVGGFVDGRLAGIAILGHPGNDRHPQTVRIHPSEPFFNYAPSQLGDWSIRPGSPWVGRYRFITYDGEPEAGELDRLWNDYAYPPGVSVAIIH
ncbi:MAG: PmoA family protein [Balneolales bacterium]